MSLPEGLPELPFGMKWEWEEAGELRDTPAQNTLLAGVNLEQRSRISISIRGDKRDYEKEEWITWGGAIRFSMLTNAYGFTIWTPTYPTIQEAAKAAVDLLAPFVQLSTLGGKP